MLGKIEFTPLKIWVSKGIERDLPRWRFTLIHEIGHLILHSTILKDRIQNKSDTENSLSFSLDVSDMTNRRLEIQANIFASHLLLPIDPLMVLVERYFKQERINKGYLYLDHQACNKKLVFDLLNQIIVDYAVSVQVAKIRLIQLGLLKDVSEKSVFSILKSLGY